MWKRDCKPFTVVAPGSLFKASPALDRAPRFLFRFQRRMKRLRSLLIDDEPNARVRLRRLLKDEEHVEVMGEAKDGLEAVAEIERLKPDLVFLDVQMPGLDGFETLKALSPELPLPLIIFVTGFHEHAMAAFDANAIAYLLKPIEPERLREMVERAWRLQHFAEDRVKLPTKCIN